MKFCPSNPNLTGKSAAQKSCAVSSKSPARCRERDKRCALDVRVEEKTDCGTYERQLITYASEPGSRVPAYLLVPKAALASRKKTPAVLCLHPTDMEYGHRVTVEKMRDYYRAYAHDLAERGFVTLAPAYPVMANYQPDLKALGWQSGTLKAVWDNIRGLDLLDSLPFVKRGKVWRHWSLARRAQRDLHRGLRPANQSHRVELRL